MKYITGKQNFNRLTYLLDVLEELKATVIHLCRRDYVAALQLKTSQQIFNTVCTAAGQFMIVTNFDKYPVMQRTQVGDNCCPH